MHDLRQPLGGRRDRARRCRHGPRRRGQRRRRPYDVLVFSKTAGSGTTRSRPASRRSATWARPTTSPSPRPRTPPPSPPRNLAQYEAVVFLNTTGDVLNATQQTAFESYIRAGGGYVGVHAAADTEYDWPFYGNLVGAYFASHPAIQQANVKVENRAHAATAHLPQTWTRTDEWYNYRTNPRSTARVLATLDESSYSGGGDGRRPPASPGARRTSGGRSFYTGVGHTQRVLRRAELPQPAARRHPVRGRPRPRPTAGRRPATPRCTTARPPAGRRPARAASPTPTPRSPRSAAWACSGTARSSSRSYSLKLDWRLPGDDNSGVFVGFPPSHRPVVGGEQRLRDPDRRHRRRRPHHRLGLRASSRADIAARDAALNPPGEWNTYELLVEGERLRVFLNGAQINDFTNTDPARSLRRATSASRTTAPATRCRSATSGSRSWADRRPADGPCRRSRTRPAAGCAPFTKAGANGGQTLGYIDPGDWAAYNGVNLAGATSFRARVVSGGPGGTIQVRTGSATGPVLGTVAVPNTGSWTTFADVHDAA